MKQTLEQASTDALKDASRALLAAGTDPSALGGRFPPEVAGVLSLCRGPGGQVPREALHRHALQVSVANLDPLLCKHEKDTATFPLNAGVLCSSPKLPHR